MPKFVDRLNADFVAATNAPGRYHDGAGLYLVITDGGKSWLYRYTLRARTREMGLGSVAAFPLAAARKRARAVRQQVEDGIDPIDAKRAAEAAERAQEARFVSFKEEARACIAAHRKGWGNSKHAEQWETTIEVYAYPVIGALHVAAVDTDLVLKVLEPIWTSKPETASRLRGRIEKVLAFSTTRKFRSGDNPARWRHHLELLLPARSKVRRVRHHPALPYAEIGDFMVDLRNQDGIAAAALELTILSATRTIETIGAEPSEFDLRAKIWTIPAGRMKMKREHRVPLCDRAIEILRPLLAQPGRFVFPGPGKAGHLSNNAMLALLARMKFGHVTTHGFRSTFKDWASERTSFPVEVSEAALAHVSDDKTQAAYLRGDFFVKRRRLMEAWANYCNMPSAKAADVVPIAAAGKRVNEREKLPCTAYDHTKSKIKFGFDDLGAQTLKNIAEPVRVYRVAGTPAVAVAVPKLDTDTDKLSIAILPLVNISSDAEQDYFADGLTEDIITELSRFKSLFVIARNSTFR